MFQRCGSSYTYSRCTLWQNPRVRGAVLVRCENVAHPDSFPFVRFAEPPQHAHVDILLPYETLHYCIACPISHPWFYSVLVLVVVVVKGLFPNHAAAKRARVAHRKRRWYRQVHYCENRRPPGKDGCYANHRGMGLVRLLQRVGGERKKRLPGLRFYDVVKILSRRSYQCAAFLVRRASS